MTDTTYTVAFAGEIMEGNSELQVKANLASVLKLDPSKVEKLFSGKNIVIKRNLDENDARRFKAAFERSGAVCIVTPRLHERRTKPRAKSTAPAEAIKLPPADIAFCRACGEKIASTDEICPSCGVRQTVGTPRKRFGVGATIGVALALVVVVGIVALVALPAYQDYIQTANADKASVETTTDSPAPVVAAAPQAPTSQPQNVATGSTYTTATPTSGIALELAESFTPRNDVEAARNTTVFIDTGFGTGSGFFLNNACLIVTNRHVIEMDDEYLRELESQRSQLKTVLDSGNLGRSRTDEFREALSKIESALAAQDGAGNARQIFISLVNGRSIQAYRLAISDELDLAYLSIKESNCPQIQTNTEDNLALGSKVFTIGNPAGMKYTVTAGIVSGYQSDEDKEFIQTDAAINPGNSGGPLIDPDGRLLGVNTMILRETEGIGFAIPTNALLADYNSYRPEIEATLGSARYQNWTPQEVREDTEISRMSSELLAETVSQCREAYYEDNKRKALSHCIVGVDNGDPESMYYMAQMTYSSTDPSAKEQALSWLHESRKAGFPNAQYLAAELLKQGIYRDESTDHMTLYEEACAQDYAPACNDLAIEYLNQHDYEQAPDYLLKARRLGSIVAVANLAFMYDSGRGVQSDDKRSYELSLEAAKLGRNQSALHVAVHYYTGEGVKKDYQLAYAWALVSEMDEKDRDNETSLQTASENVRFLLERLLSDQQKSESMQLAKGFLTEIEDNLEGHREKHAGW